MYDKDRCFMYNKAYYEAFIGELLNNHEGFS